MINNLKEYKIIDIKIDQKEKFEAVISKSIVNNFVEISEENIIVSVGETMH